ncbi:hypothetical protein ACWF7H_23535 [Peribacillus butanolivorans]|uniref:hypothetical protein n=1 Tax=Peribacillus butanolivorans TaxID=421767 RepID=UPI0036B32181
MNWVDFMALTGILFYLVPIAFIAWFLTSFIKTQKERNTILRDISLKLDKYKIDKKEE